MAHWASVRWLEVTGLEIQPTQVLCGHPEDEKDWYFHMYSVRDSRKSSKAQQKCSVFHKIQCVGPMDGIPILYPP